MLIELLSTSNYVSYNTKLAQLLGLHASIYLSELMSINDKAIRKDKTSESSFVLDREYMTRRTTFDIEEQLEIEKNLIKLSILEKPSDDKNCIIINLHMLTTLIMSTDDELLENVESLAKLKKASKSRSTKSDSIKAKLMRSISATNDELREAYSIWIDSVCDKENWMSKAAVLEGQSVVDNFSQHNLDVALKVINIASIHGLRDMNWAVDKYKEQYRVKGSIAPKIDDSPLRVSSEVF